MPQCCTEQAQQTLGTDTAASHQDTAAFIIASSWVCIPIDPVLPVAMGPSEHWNLADIKQPIAISRQPPASTPLCPFVQNGLCLFCSLKRACLFDRPSPCRCGAAALTEMHSTTWQAILDDYLGMLSANTFYPADEDAALMAASMCPMMAASSVMGGDNVSLCTLRARSSANELLFRSTNCLLKHSAGKNLRESDTLTNVHRAHFQVRPHVPYPPCSPATAGEGFRLIAQRVRMGSVLGPGGAPAVRRHSNHSTP